MACYWDIICMRFWYCSNPDDSDVCILTAHVESISFRHLIQLYRALVAIQQHLWKQKLAKTSIYNLHVVLVFTLPQYYLDTAKQHLSLTGPKQLFFHSTTTYWVKQSTQPSLAIPLGVPRACAKSLQLSLPYLLLMNALRYTNPRHYQSQLSHTFKRDFWCSLWYQAFCFSSPMFY